MNVKPKIGIHIKLLGNAPLDAKLHDILNDMRNTALHPSHQFYLGDFTVNIDKDFISFYIDVVLWQPFGNAVAEHIWQALDLLLGYQSIQFDISGITGYEGIDPVL